MRTYCTVLLYLAQGLFQAGINGQWSRLQCPNKMSNLGSVSWPHHYAGSTDSGGFVANRVL